MWGQCSTSGDFTPGSLWHILRQSLHALISMHCAAVERRLLKSGVVFQPTQQENDSDDDTLTPLEHMRQKVYSSRHGRGSDDEDSDFD